MKGGVRAVPAHPGVERARSAGVRSDADPQPSPLGQGQQHGSQTQPDAETAGICRGFTYTLRSPASPAVPEKPELPRGSPKLCPSVCQKGPALPARPRAGCHSPASPWDGCAGGRAWPTELSQPQDLPICSVSPRPAAERAERRDNSISSPWLHSHVLERRAPASSHGEKGRDSCLA